VITPANYIAEIMCQRKAEIDNSGSLPKKYWNLPQYKNHYKSQLTKASSLLKTYDVLAVVRAIKKSYKIYSLRVKWFENAIRKEQAILDAERKSRKETVIRTETKVRKPQASGKTNLFGEL
jgi:phosphate uptake regulator